MTKFIALAAAAFAATATVAAADNYLPFTAETQANDGVVEFDAVRAGNDGVIEIYSFHAGEVGALLGTEAVNEGANANVRVGLGRAPITDVIALLKVDGQVVDSQEIDFQ